MRIRTAVARQHVARSWPLAAPSLKAGVTRKQWNRGDLPVVPYPALDKGLGKWDFVQYSYTDTIGLEVFLFPKPGSGYSALTADVELVKGHNGRWLVDYWMPKKFHGPPAVAAKAAKPRKAAGKRRHQPNKARAASEPMPAVKTSRPSRAYWAVPLGPCDSPYAAAALKRGPSTVAFSVAAIAVISSRLSGEYGG